MKGLKKLLFVLGILVAAWSILNIFVTIGDMAVSDFGEGLKDGYFYSNEDPNVEDLNSLFLGEKHSFKYYYGFMSGNSSQNDYTFEEIRYNAENLEYGDDILKTGSGLLKIAGSIIVFIISLSLIPIVKGESSKKKLLMGRFIAIIVFSGGFPLPLIYGVLGITYSLLIDKEPNIGLRFKKGVFVLGILVTAFAAINMIQKVVELSISDFNLGYNSGVKYVKKKYSLENQDYSRMLNLNNDFINDKGNAEYSLDYFNGFSIGSMGGRSAIVLPNGPDDSATVDYLTKASQKAMVQYVVTIIVFFLANIITFIFGILITLAYKTKDASRVLNRLLIFSIIIIVLGNSSMVTLALAVLVLVGISTYKEEQKNETITAESIEAEKAEELVEEEKTEELIEEEKTDESIEEETI